MHYYQHHLGDYAKDTAHLSVAEHGAYRLLMDYYYSTEKPLPASVDALCRICRAITKIERAAVESVAREFFQDSGDGLVQKRVQKELSDYAEMRSRNAEKGKLGGRPRKSRGKPGGLSGEKPNESLTSTHKPLTNNHTPLPPKGEDVSATVALYPKNGNRYEAAAALLRHIENGEDIGFIRECVQIHSAAYAKLPKAIQQKCPGPVLYFAEARWRDNPESFPWVWVDDSSKPEDTRKLSQRY